MRVIYNTGIAIYIFALHIVALFNRKVKTMLQGEARCFDTLKTINPEDRVVWFHCASLGEFEQGRPLIEALKAGNPNHKILLSFYSPSGYEIRKDYSFAEWVVYLPNDTESNARQFVSYANPRLTFFVKYEFWYNYLKALKGRRVFQVSLILRPDQYFFKPYGKWFVRRLEVFEHFFVQNEQTLELLESAGYKNVSISGDTRFDRVAQIAKNAKRFPQVEEFCSSGEKILLAGSSWEEDENIIARLPKDIVLKYIIAPHVVSEAHIKALLNLFPEAVLYSEAGNHDLSKKKVLIIDCIGILSSLYGYCDIAYIGGGFGAGIHNTLEAATFGKPVCFGTNYKHFQEAVDLVERKAAFCIRNTEELTRVLERLCNDIPFYDQSAGAALDYTREKAGACKIILDYLKA